MKNRKHSFKLQSSFELLVTLSFGLAILLPLVVFAFIQIASANSALSAIAAQQTASKIASIATLVGSEGPPARQMVQVAIPIGVQNIFVGTLTSTPGVGHEIAFVVRSPTGLSYVTSYVQLNVSGTLGGISSPGTYLVNVSALSQCSASQPVPCVYISSVT
jgi:hypothetical protein